MAEIAVALVSHDAPKISGHPSSYTGQCGFSARKKCEEDAGALTQLVLNNISGFIRKYQRPPNFIELGCGDGGLSVKMAMAGARVVACDVLDNLNPTAKETCNSGKIRFVKKPMQALLLDDLPSEINGVVAERSLHWLSFKEAHRTLCKLAQRAKVGAPLFASLGALDSPLKQGYPFDGGTPIHQRHGGDPIDGNPYSHARTLYAYAEAKTLAEASGFSNNADAVPTEWGLWNLVARRSNTVPSFCR